MTGSVAAILLWAILGSYQTLVLPGTALPISLDCTLDAKRVKPGQPISGTITQDIPLGDRGKIKEGSHVLGYVVDVGRRSDQSSYIRIRFDRLRAKDWDEMPIMTSLRAMATPWEVQEAQLPKVGPMVNPNPYSWTTYQVGGDAVLRGGGPVMHGKTKIGVPAPGTVGVYARLISVNQPGCKVEGGGPLVALWVFGSAACGAYGFDDELAITSAGNDDPLGEIVLESDGNVKVETGTGMLLITLSTKYVPVLAAKN